MASSSLSFLLALALLGGAFAQSFTCGNADNQTVCNALSAFYTATGGASWTTRTGWGGGTSYCTPWYGLTCVSNLVTKFSFSSNNNLVGTLPDIFDSFSSSLTSFQVGANQLSGTLPPSFFNLHSQITIGGSGLSPGALPYKFVQTLASVGQVYSGSYFPPAATIDFSSFGSGSGGSSTPFDPTSLLASLAALNNTQLALAATAAGQNSSVGTQQTQLNALIASNAAMNTTNSALSASNAAMNTTISALSITNAALNATTATLQAQYTQLASLVTALQVNLTAARAAISAAG